MSINGQNFPHIPFHFRMFGPIRSTISTSRTCIYRFNKSCTEHHHSFPTIKSFFQSFVDPPPSFHAPTTSSPYHLRKNHEISRSRLHTLSPHPLPRAISLQFSRSSRPILRRNAPFPLFHIPTNNAQQTCLASAAAAVGCGTSDYACQCSPSQSAAIGSSALPCVVSGCGPVTGLAVQSSAAAVCACAATAGPASSSAKATESAASSPSAYSSAQQTDSATSAGSAPAMAPMPTVMSSAGESSSVMSMSTGGFSAGNTTGIMPYTGGAPTNGGAIGGIMGALLAVAAAF